MLPAVIQPVPYASAQAISSPPQINIQFNPSAILPGQTSRLVITISNPNAFQLVDAAWMDDLPAGLTIASPANVSNTCGGTLIAQPGGTAVALSGGTVPAQVNTTPGSCTVGVDVTSTTPGNLTSTIPAGGLTAVGGGFVLANTQPASATLSVASVQPPEVSIHFNPAEINIGETSRLTITVKNNDAVHALTQINLSATLPENVTGAIPDNRTLSGCGDGTLPPVSGLRELNLNNASIAAGDSCTISVDVIPAQPGVYTGIIPAGAVRTSEGVTNIDPAFGTLTVISAPQLQVIKTVISNGPFILGSTITYNIELVNKGSITLTNVTVTDADLDASKCDPAIPATLNPGQSLRCPASHVVTPDDLLAGTYTNTATGSSDQTGAVTDSVTVPLASPAGLIIKKTVTSSGPYSLGSTITYKIALRNIGSEILTNAQVTDTGAVVDSCTPALGSQLLIGESMTCTASHTVTQADIDAGFYTNTATGTAFDPFSQPVQAESTVTVPIQQNPALTVLKHVTNTKTFSKGDTINYEIAVINTGDVTLTDVIVDPGKDVTLGTCSPATPATLPVGGQLKCTASHVVTQADIDAGSFTSTASARSAQTPPVSSSVTTSFTQTPRLALSTNSTLDLKKAGPTDRVDAGDTIEYSFTVTNTGNVTLTDITLTDLVPGVTVSGTIASLDPGDSDSTTLTATYTLKQEDIDKGSFTNTARVTGFTPGGLEASAQASDTQTLVADPKIALTTVGQQRLDVTAPPDRADAGDTIEYSFTVTNTGNVTLTDITLTSLVPGVAVSGGPIASLAPGDSDSTTFTASYTLAQSDIDTGEFTGTFEVAGEWTSSSGQVTVATAQASDTQSIEEKPGIKLTKSGGVDPSVKNPFNIANPGDPIRYGITVENTGNVTLKGLRLTDPGAVFTVPYPPGVEVPPKDEDGQPTNGHLAKIDSLAPGAKITLNGYHTTLVDDFRRKSYTNTATVTGTPPSGQPVSAQSSHTEQLAPDPKIELRITTATQDLAKAGPADRVDAGDSITYTLTVKNIGNVPLTNVNLTSPVPGVVISGGPIASLEEDLSTTFTASYTLTQNDIDTGEFSGTFEVAGEWTSSSGDMMVATAQASDTQTLVADPKIALTTVGTLNTGSNNRVDAGDTISYAFTITNTGNVTLTDITLTDLVPGVAVSGGPIASLSPGDSDSTTFTASYTLTQADVDAGSFTNRVQVTGTPPNNAPNVTDEDEVTTPLAPVPVVGAAKQVVGSPVEVSTGVWDVTFEIRVRNYSNVTLSQLQVSEDLSAAFPIRKPDDAFAGNTPLPAVASFSVQSVTSTDFTPNASFNGTSDQNLLAGTDALAPGAEGTVQLVVRVTPITGGPFENSMTVRAATPGQKTVEDRSQNGSSPDPDNDGDPTNNNAPTPVNFGTLFQPPVGEKRVNTPDEDLLQWTLEWMNNANIQPLPVIVYDPIPQGTTYYARGLASSYPLPAGQLPSGSTTTGVSCTAASPATKTTACYYEGPTAEFPRGRVIWEGILAPDHLVETLEAAANKITIRFATRADKDAGQIHNTAVAGADLNVDGSIRGQDELQAAAAAADWVRPTKLPRTGFAPNMASHLPPQPAEKAYQQVGEMRLEIPALGVNVPVVGVPLTDGQWDVTWLGQNAGYLAGTSFPTWQGNAVITAHVYDANGLPGPFVNLKQLKWGDKILLHAFGSVYEFEVRTARRVQPDDLSIMETQKGTWVTLVTCESYDEASDSYRYRFAVQAVLMQVRQAGQ